MVVLMKKTYLYLSAMTFVFLMVLAYNARADVLTCAIAGCASPAPKPKPDVVAADLVLFCAGDVSDGKCSDQRWIPWGTTQSYSQVLTDTGWYRVEYIPVVYVPPKYACYPKSIGEYRVAHEGDAGVILWYCDTPTRIRLHYFCGAPSKLPAALLTLALDKLGIAMQASMTRRCTDEENALIDKLHASEGVKLVVAPSSTSNTRPIYASLGVPSGKRATVGDPCGFDRLKNLDGTGSNYFSVPGGYTFCKVMGVVSK
jgi:hypothetical protein